MEINYIIIGSYFIVFFIGIFFGVFMIKFFSSEIVEKLTYMVDSQLQQSEDFFENSIQKLTLNLHEKIEYIEKVNTILLKFKELLSANHLQIKQLNKSCDTRQKLESEIIKLKKIIQRLEKKI